jgi:hypothetical protein
MTTKQLAEAGVTRIVMPGQNTQPCISLLADLVAVEEIARLSLDLNLSNYNHDDVCLLSAAMCELYNVVRKYRPEANTALKGADEGGVP